MATGCRQSTLISKGGLDVLKTQSMRLYLLSALPGTFKLSCCTATAGVNIGYVNCAASDTANATCASFTITYAVNSTSDKIVCSSATGWNLQKTAVAQYVGVGASSTAASGTATGIFYIVPLSASQTISATNNVVITSSWTITMGYGDTA